jgi:Domain of unknown function (DUF397)
MASVGASRPEWRRSSDCYSSDCVEVAAHHGHVLIRDSSANVGPVLRFTPDQWRRFARELSSIPPCEGIAIEAVPSWAA